MAKSCTTLMIAHRLDTIKKADVIVVLGKGCVLELGSHDELLALEGVYYSIVNGNNPPRPISRLSSARSWASWSSFGAQSRSSRSTPSSNGSHRRRIGNDSNTQSRRTSESAGLLHLLEDAMDGLYIDPSSDNLEDEYELQHSLRQWLKTLKTPLLHYRFVAYLAAFLEGALWPVFSIMLTFLINTIMFDYDSDQTILTYMGAMIGVGGAQLVAQVMKMWSMSAMKARVSFDVKSRAFAVWLQHPLCWHDVDDHAPHLLAASLKGVEQLNQFLFDRPYLLVQLLSSTAVGIALSVYFCWRVGLVSLACVPVLGGLGLLIVRLTVTMAHAAWEGHVAVGGFAADCLDNMRAVLTQGGLGLFQARFAALMAEAQVGLGRRMQYFAVLSGLLEFSQFGAWGLTFWYGGEVVLGMQCAFGDMLKAILSILITSMLNNQLQVCLWPWLAMLQLCILLLHLFKMILGSSCVVFPNNNLNIADAVQMQIADASKQIETVKTLFFLIHETETTIIVAPPGQPPQQDSNNEVPARHQAVLPARLSHDAAKAALSGAWDFVDVHFAYPARPEAAILQGLTFRMVPGSMTALVGRSGFGKSTIMGLLQRLYEPGAGLVAVGGHSLAGIDIVGKLQPLLPVPEFDIDDLRSQMAVLTQVRTLVRTPWLLSSL